MNNRFPWEEQSMFRICKMYFNVQNFKLGRVYMQRQQHECRVFVNFPLNSLAEGPMRVNVQCRRICGA